MINSWNKDMGMVVNKYTNDRWMHTGGDQFCGQINNAKETQISRDRWEYYLGRFATSYYDSRGNCYTKKLSICFNCEINKWHNQNANWQSVKSYVYYLTLVCF